MIKVHRAINEDFASVCTIIEEYFNAIGVLIRDDHNQLRVYLEENAGGVWLALDEVSIVGCVVLRPLTTEPEACEIKRLYVKEPHRGIGVADALLDALEGYAYEYGYRVAYLDTKDDLQAALRFYERRGYQECERYNENPQATRFMRQQLKPSVQLSCKQ